MDWAGVNKSSSDEKEQGSQAWLKWRNKGIGSSDAAVLLGLSPWKDITELYEEKLGLRTQEFSFAQRSAMDRGKRLEPVIRDWYEAQVSAKFPDDTAEHPEHKFMRASFDGRNKDLDKVLEIKAPNAKDHELAKNGMVPEKYIPQCQWLMMVGGHKLCDYVSRGSDDSHAVVNMIRDPEMQDELTKRALIFWECVSTKTPPDLRHFSKWQPGFKEPLDLTKTETQTEIPLDPPQITDQEVEALVALCLSLQDSAKQMEAAFNAAKEKLKIALGKDEKRECGEAVFGWQKRKGQVDYSIIPELIGLDLDQFRKPDTKAFYFKRKEK